MSAPRLLRGRVAPALLRAAAIVVVAWGAAKKARAQGDTRPSAPPGPAADRAASRAVVVPEVVALDPRPPSGFERAVARVGLDRRPTRRFEAASRPFADLDAVRRARLADDVARLRPELPLRALVLADLAAAEAGEELPPLDPRTLSTALADAEDLGLFDAGLVAWARRRAARGPAADLAALFSALHAHARACDALVLLAARLERPGEPRWQSKAGPPPHPAFSHGPRPVPAKTAAHPGLPPDVVADYARLDAGPWDREGALLVRVAAGDGVLLRRGGRAAFATGDVLEIRRLDVVVAGPGGLRLDTARCGALGLDAGSAFDLRGAADALAPAGRAAVARAVGAALKDPEDPAVHEIESAVALYADAVRAAVKSAPDATGAARLRLLLSLFDA